MKNRKPLTPDELWIETGAMFSRADREEVTPRQARECFRGWLQRKASGDSPEDLSPEMVVALGEDGDDPRMPAKYAKLLGLKGGARYGNVFRRKDPIQVEAVAAWLQALAWGSEGENGMKTEDALYVFRIKKTHSNVRVRDCEHCRKRTKQLQGEDSNGKYVEKYECRSCLEETR